MQPQVVRIEPANPLAAARAFKVVLFCDSDEKRSRGLQGFRKLRPHEAALFSFDPPQTATFWMGTVSYAIDILFVDARGAVVAVFADLRPGSKDLYPSPSLVRWVVETAARSGVGVGDRISIE